MGLIKDKSARKRGNAHLENFYFLGTELIDSYFTPNKQLKKLGVAHEEYRTDNRDIFKPPILLFKEGANEHICTSVVTFKCAYQSSALGIKFIGKGIAYYKAVAACLNSSLSLYYYLMTSSSLGVDRERVQKNEILDFPALPIQMHDKTIHEISGKVDEIKLVRDNSTVQFNQVARIYKLRKEIDDIIYRTVGISENEKVLIEDALNYSIIFRNRYIENGGERHADTDKDVIPYASAMQSALNSIMKNTSKHVKIEVLSAGKNDPLRIIALRFTNIADSKEVSSYSEQNLENLIKKINLYTYEKHSESVYYRKVVKYFTKSSIYYVKPNKKKYWTKAQALNDSDGILVDLMS
jgi:hypothetical protein